MHAGNSGMGLSKHRKAQRHKAARSRYVYDHATKLINDEIERAERRRQAAKLTHSSVIEAFRNRKVR